MESEEEIPAIVWCAAVLTSAACISSIVLSVQRRYYHKTTKSFESLQFDTTRDYKVPFSDHSRISRVLFNTIVMTVLSAYAIYDSVIQCENTATSNKTCVYKIISFTLIFIAWLYALIISIVSRKYSLPNRWGWILNVHLFCFYLSSVCISLYRLWDAFRLQHKHLSLVQGLPLILSILFSLDLFYTTGSIEQGPPYLEGDKIDDDEKTPVAGITVASIFSILYFSWATPIVDSINENAHDIFLPSLPPIYRAYNLFYIFGEHRNKSLIYRLYHSNKEAIILQSICTAISATLYYGPAFFLNRLLSLIQDIDAGKEDEFYFIKGVMIVSGLSLSLIILSIVVGQLYYLSSSSLRVRIKSMLNIEIYRKTLRRMDIPDMARDNATSIEVEEGGSSTVGTIVNLMSTDSQRISDFTTDWFTIIEAPIELLVGITFLYSLLGSSCLLGLSVMIITLPLNHYNSVLFAKTQEKLMEARDRRISLMNEVLQGIRQIKFFAWESSWEHRVLEARNEELKHLKKTYVSEVLFNFLWQGTPLLVTIVSFYSFTKIQGHQLTAPIAFTAITVFTELRSALNTLPETFVDVLQALISVRRIESYLEEEEISPPLTNLDPSCRVRIGFRNATISWTDIVSDEDVSDEDTSIDHHLLAPTHTEPSSFEEADTFLLHNLNVHFPNGEFSLICGATGSGKTLMMLGLLGEVALLEGESFCPRTSVSDNLEENMTQINWNMNMEHWILDHAVAYASQTAWLLNSTIRDNILFGSPYLKKRYQDTLIACSLDKDIQDLEDGDRTEVGEKGITLSGGQKARVALARAVYSRAKNVLLDDVLSAVDAHTAKHLYNKCLIGPLMEGRTRILITHHVGLCISGASYLVHLENGRIDLCGSPEELEASGTLGTILDEVISLEEQAIEENEETIEEEVEKIDPQPVGSTSELLKRASIDKTAKVLVKEETRAVGHVQSRLYLLYLRAVGNPLYWCIILAFVFGSRGLDVTESWWIKKWVHSNESANNTIITTTSSSILGSIRYLFMDQPNVPSPIENNLMSSQTLSYLSLFSKGNEDNNQLDMYLNIYILITLTNIVVGASRFASLYYGTIKASKNLYQILLQKVLRAPMRFFDTTPIGRILNRFSKDFEYLDASVPNDLMYFIIQWLVILTSILTVCVVLPIFIIPMMVVTFLNIMIGKRYSAASRELRRMDSVTRSPLITHFGETIVGVTTIRAYGATQKFMKEMLRKIDENSKPFYYVWISNRWVGIRFSFLGAAVNFCTGIFILLSLDYMDASLAGFCLSFVLSYTSQMTMAIKRYTRLEMSFNAVERVVEFIEIEQEPPAITDKRPPPEWPMNGEIEVKDLVVRYAPDLEPVLKGLTFSVKPREKIGVVGRTGSGKSTLALSFFRFVEPSEGSIIIDGINICDIGLTDLRSHLTIIPQDPVLFSGSLRSNLDPFDEFDDDSIFAALKRVELIPSEIDVYHQHEEILEDSNFNIFLDLSSPVSEGGLNFSQGQRQLICLARALLKSSTVVFMDEATASVDFETDEEIQKTIALEFKNSTILCIAHRLRTVIEYDRILVLDQGEIVEFASPLELINTPNSIFNKMCENSGEYEALVALAKEKHQLIDV